MTDKETIIAMLLNAGIAYETHDNVLSTNEGDVWFTFDSKDRLESVLNRDEQWLGC